MKSPKRIIKVLHIEGAPSEKDFGRKSNEDFKGGYPAGEVKISKPHAFKGKRIGSIYGKRVGPIE